MRKDTNIWVLEDDPSAQMVYRETIGYIYQTTFFTRLDEFSAALKALDDKKEVARHTKEHSRESPELIIADIKLEDGFFSDYLEENGESTLPCPFLVVSVCDNMDILRWYSKQGSLDFLIKPFKKNELLLRLERIIDSASVDRIFNYFKKHEIQLTEKEKQILRLFLNRGKVVTGEEIVKEVWRGTSVHKNNVNVQISNLRDKLGGTSCKIRYIGDRAWIFDCGQLVGGSSGLGKF